MWALSDSQFVYIFTSTAWWNLLWTHRSQSRGEQPMGMQVVSGLANNSEPWKRAEVAHRRTWGQFQQKYHVNPIDNFLSSTGVVLINFDSSQVKSQEKKMRLERHITKPRGELWKVPWDQLVSLSQKVIYWFNWLITPFIRSKSISELTRWVTPLTILRLLGVSLRWNTLSNFGSCWIFAFGWGKWG